MKRTLNFLILVALGILLLIRIFCDKTEWIVEIQYIGMAISYIDLFVDIVKKLHGRFQYNYVYLGFLVGAIIMIVIMLLAITVRVDCLVDSRALDIVTILTLVFSLPKELIIDFFEKLTEGKTNEKKD